MLYPSGNVKRDGSDHISLYLAIAEPNAIPPGSQVDVILKFFVFDHLRDEYLTIQGGFPFSPYSVSKLSI